MARLNHTDWPDRLWVIRHGQSAGNVARDHAEATGAELIDLTTRDADTPLSHLGERQSEALGKWFAALPRSDRPSALLTSPFIRSQQTCFAIADAIGMDRTDVHVDERLREKEFGILDRYTKHGILAKFPELAAQRQRVGKFYFRPPGGESWCDVILRLRSVVEELRRDHVGERVVIVAHQVIVNCCRYLRECLDERDILDIDKRADVPNCAITDYRMMDENGERRFRLAQANFVLPVAESGAPITTAPDKPAGPK